MNKKQPPYTKEQYPYTYACIELYNCLSFEVIPHLVVTDAMFNARHEGHPFYTELFYQFIELGYNPFRKGMTQGEKIQVKNIIAVLDKMERRCKL